MGLYEHLTEAYDSLFPVNPATLAFLEARFAAGKGDCGSVLDLGSATGGHALALAAQGWRVTGIEPCLPMVDKATRSAESRRIPALFRAGTMEEAAQLFPTSRFGLVLCLGNTLPHLPSEAALSKVLHDIAGLAATQGGLVIQMLNYSLAGPGMVFPAIEGGGYRLERAYAPEPEGERLVFRTRLTAPEGSIWEDSTLLMPLRPARLLEALAEAGFPRIESCSGWDGAAFAEERSPYLILSAIR